MKVKTNQLDNHMTLFQIIRKGWIPYHHCRHHHHCHHHHHHHQFIIKIISFRKWKLKKVIWPPERLGRNPTFWPNLPSRAHSVIIEPSMKEVVILCSPLHWLKQENKTINKHFHWKRTNRPSTNMDLVGPLAASLQNAIHLNLESEVAFCKKKKHCHAYFLFFNWWF